MVDLRGRIQSALTAFLAEQTAALGDIAGDLAPLTDELAAYVAGGKRLRPAFCYWAFRGLGGVDGEEIVRAAASLELLQTCALLHDDLMDLSDTRRGRPAAHRVFAALHATRGWAGDADRFGASATLLLGDLVLSWCEELLTRCGLPANVVDAARPAFDRMRSEVVAGQYLDLLEQVRAVPSVAGALRVITYKTVRYTVLGPLQLGAALAGSPGERGFAAYGTPLGEAFQLRDDLLGVYGDPAVTGKPAGDDLREGKHSVLVALGAERGVDLTGLGTASVDIDRLSADLTKCGAVEALEEMISVRLDAALTALPTLGLTAEATTALHELALAATTRAA